MRELMTHASFLNCVKYLNSSKGAFYYIPRAARGNYRFSIFVVNLSLRYATAPRVELKTTRWRRWRPVRSFPALIKR